MDENRLLGQVKASRGSKAAMPGVSGEASFTRSISRPSWPAGRRARVIFRGFENMDVFEKPPWMGSRRPREMTLVRRPIAKNNPGSETQHHPACEAGAPK